MFCPGLPFELLLIMAWLNWTFENYCELLLFVIPPAPLPPFVLLLLAFLSICALYRMLSPLLIWFEALCPLAAAAARLSCVPLSELGAVFMEPGGTPLITSFRKEFCLF